MSNWFWSERESGASYHGPHETREEAIAEARAEGAARIFVGQSHTVEVEVDASDAIGQWANATGVDVLYEDALDFWCSRIPREKLEACSKEMTEVFKKHLELWGEETEWEVISDAVEVVEP